MRARTWIVSDAVWFVKVRMVCNVYIARGPEAVRHRYIVIQCMRASGERAQRSRRRQQVLYVAGVLYRAVSPADTWSRRDTRIERRDAMKVGRRMWGNLFCVLVFVVSSVWGIVGWVLDGMVNNFVKIDPFPDFIVPDCS